MENKIPDNILNLIKKNYSYYLNNPIEKILKYIEENNILEFEFEKRYIERDESIWSDIEDKNILGVIEYLKGINNPDKKTLYIENDSLYIIYRDIETDEEYAERLFKNVISPVNYTLNNAKNNRKNLIKEKQELEKRLKEINSIL